jgi:VanZ family protein
LRRLLILTVALILYGSVYPWQFVDVPAPHGKFWFLLQIWPDRFGRDEAVDLITNVFLYLPVGFFGFLAFVPRLGCLRGILLTLFTGFAASLSAETAQLYLVVRDPTILDVIVNVFGTAAGVAAAWVVSHREAPRWFTDVLPRVDAAMLLFLWTGAQLFPFTPSRHLSWRGHLVHEPWAFTPLYFFEALLCARLYRLVAGRLGWGFIALQSLVLARLLLAYRTVSLEELLTVGAGTATAMLWPEPPPLLIFFVASILLQGLAPFRFSGHNEFIWMPFESLIQINWIEAFPLLMTKAFRYGGLVWLMNAAGWKWPRASMVVMLLLAGIEIAQVFLPGRTAELTDPVLALIMGFTLWSVREAGNRPGDTG